MPRIDREDRGLTLRAASTLALAGVLATGCDSHRAQNRDPSQETDYLTTALALPAPSKLPVIEAQPAPEPATQPAPRLFKPPSPRHLLVEPAAPRIELPSRALVTDAPTVPTGPVELPAVEPEPEATAQLAAAVLAPTGGALEAETVINDDPADLAYIPQISDSARAAYIAQVDAAAPGQRMAVRAGDQVLGQVEFQVANGQVSVRIGQVLDLFEGQMNSAEFARLQASGAALEFVSLDRLQDAGIPIDYNAAYDELTLDTGRS